ncbi:cation:proton antiporter [Mucisphaera calidilacus]|uniref:Inner membrane protein YbaL n=1 Tax=Mucisphaera calidilacus TaxID=2527982 RepID=A0A518BX31_9BACT|nr:cation:proton antiporter [Mucisphaera calidilacus]QDU71538.1 Inner membrane protein YbaL [Mucisphaera calidilacus]
MTWHLLLDILMLLGAALVLGVVAERLRQSAILGYLVAGTLVGPAAFALVDSTEEVHAIAELGVAMLLFSIGLEFSLDRLRRLGSIALIGGTAQILLTLVVAAGAAWGLGLGPRAAIGVGALLALSSTACVLRILSDRGAIDTLYGRNSLGILLMQDVAVVPLVLLLTVLARGGSVDQTMATLGKTLGLGLLLIGAFLLLFRYIAPRLFRLRPWAQNRDLPVLLAIVMAIGSAIAAHEMGISPAMGAFVAGVLLGESPFAVQVRADVASLRTLFVTLFFASVGMLGDPGWVAANVPLVGGTVAAIIIGKGLLVVVVVRALGHSTGVAMATGLCLAQAGEFSFVLAKIGRGTVFDEQLFRLIVSSTILTLFVTPFLIGLAPRVASAWTRLAVRSSRRAAPTPTGPDPAEADTPSPKRDILVIGFGPAGQQAVDHLRSDYAERIQVIELNPRNASDARLRRLEVQVGDATRQDVLEHAGIYDATVILVTIPDAHASRTVIHHCRQMAPAASVVVRARYHVVRWELQLAGALTVVDEELELGRAIATAARQHLTGVTTDSPTDEAV